MRLHQARWHARGHGASMTHGQGLWSAAPFLLCPPLPPTCCCSRGTTTTPAGDPARAPAPAAPCCSAASSAPRSACSSSSTSRRTCSGPRVGLGEGRGGNAGLEVGLISAHTKQMPDMSIKAGDLLDTRRQGLEAATRSHCSPPLPPPTSASSRRLASASPRAAASAPSSCRRTPASSPARAAASASACVAAFGGDEVGAADSGAGEKVEGVQVYELICSEQGPSARARPGPDPQPHATRHPRPATPSSHTPFAAPPAAAAARPPAPPPWPPPPPPPAPCPRAWRRPRR